MVFSAFEADERLARTSKLLLIKVSDPQMRIMRMLEANPNLSPKRIKELLIATARPLPNVPDYKQGYGVIMPRQAVAAALRELYRHYESVHLSPQIEAEQIRFIFDEPRTKKVSIIGESKDWNPDIQPMSQQEAGWVAEMKRLPAGRYHYKFLIDDDRWLDEAANLIKNVDGYGGFNSVLEL